MLCTLSNDINNCPFCDKNTMKCKKSDIKCAFLANEVLNVGMRKDEPKKEKWFEKYYKDGSRPKRS